MIKEFNGNVKKNDLIISMPICKFYFPSAWGIQSMFTSIGLEKKINTFWHLFLVEKMIHVVLKTYQI